MEDTVFGAPLLLSSAVPPGALAADLADYAAGRSGVQTTLPRNNARHAAALKAAAPEDGELGVDGG